MDKSLGNLMGWLEKNGEADNTIIIFKRLVTLASTSEWHTTIRCALPTAAAKVPFAKEHPRTDDRQLAGIAKPLIPSEQISADRRLPAGNGRGKGL